MHNKMIKMMYQSVSEDELLAVNVAKNPGTMVMAA